MPQVCWKVSEMIIQAVLGGIVYFYEPCLCVAFLSSLQKSPTLAKRLHFSTSSYTHAPCFFSNSVLQRRRLTCRGQCLFYSTGSESGHNWAYMVQVTPAEMATYFPFFNEALQ